MTSSKSRLALVQIETKSLTPWGLGGEGSPGGRLEARGKRWEGKFRRTEFRAAGFKLSPKNVGSRWDLRDMKTGGCLVLWHLVIPRKQYHINTKPGVLTIIIPGGFLQVYKPGNTINILSNIYPYVGVFWSYEVICDIWHDGNIRWWRKAHRHSFVSRKIWHSNIS